MSAYHQYLLEQAAWLRANPSATSQQIAEAMNALQQRLGV
jgi:hypothetical protein